MMRALIIAIFMALAAPSFAEDAGGPVYGLGTKRCSEMPEWIQRMEQQKVLPWGNIEQFVDGFLTAKKG